MQFEHLIGNLANGELLRPPFFLTLIDWPILPYLGVHSAFPVRNVSSLYGGRAPTIVSG